MAWTRFQHGGKRRRLQITGFLVVFTPKTSKYISENLVKIWQFSQTLFSMNLKVLELRNRAFDFFFVTGVVSKIA